MTPNQVQVHLATHNGAKFVTEFLESLLSQEDVTINLLVNDDSSKDSTVEIINSYKDKFHTLTLQTSNFSSANLNFTSIYQRKLNMQPIAFADQDDIWFPNKILTAVRYFEKIVDPCLFYSLVTLNNGKNFPTSPSNNPVHSLFRNSAMGCTQVMNQTLISLFDAMPKFDDLSDHNSIIPIDWWRFFVSVNFGTVYLHRKPLMHYRIHKGNTIGIPTVRKKLLKALNRKSFLKLSSETRYFIKYLINLRDKTCIPIHSDVAEFLTMLQLPRQKRFFRMIRFQKLAESYFYNLYFKLSCILTKGFYQ